MRHRWIPEIRYAATDTSSSAVISTVTMPEVVELSLLLTVTERDGDVTSEITSPPNPQPQREERDQDEETARKDSPEIDGLHTF